MVAGAFDLTAILAGITALQIKNGVRNIVFDGIDMVLGNLEDERLERCELARLNDWVRASGAFSPDDREVFGGRAESNLVGYLQYMTDCVIIMEDMVTATTRSRSLRIAKYRGSGFSGSPAPVVINRSGIDVVVFRVRARAIPPSRAAFRQVFPGSMRCSVAGTGAATLFFCRAPPAAKTSSVRVFRRGGMQGRQEGAVCQLRRKRVADRCECKCDWTGTAVVRRVRSSDNRVSDLFRS